MNWSNVKLIFCRETRDQLRDRRTIFMIAFLPLILYPLMGFSWVHLAQFMADHESRVQLIGASRLPEAPPLLDGNRLAEPLILQGQRDQVWLDTESAADESVAADPDFRERARQLLEQRAYDLVVYFPDAWDSLLSPPAGEAEGRLAPSVADLPRVYVYHLASRDASQLALQRVSHALNLWRQQLVQRGLVSRGLPQETVTPFAISQADLAEPQSRRVAMWSKILPFIVLVWALTGAFYPAIDLCAGEKERGTLETLLCSPAQRSEIVVGKLLTVMVFSMATSLLNLLSMGATGTFIMRQLEQAGGLSLQLGAPPLTALLWLTLALIPISALFSALAIALATFAKSTKEGHYYLMPLLLINLPLMMLPLRCELDWGTSLIPVSGLMLLIRALIEGDYQTGAVFFAPVSLVTGVCCWFSIRWAVSQFHKEAVLFRESERWGISSWLRHLVRDRGDTPTVLEALLCGVLLLMIRFFASLGASAPTSWQELVMLNVITQVAFLATPPVLMAVILTRNPWKSLGIRRPPAAALAIAVLLAVVLHPALTWLSEGVQQLYPLSPQTRAQLGPIMQLLNGAALPSVLLLIAVLPAICEELAFRGFILAGLKNLGHKWPAIAISSLFFGLVHGMVQQSVTAAVVGLLIGLIAVHGRSVFPAMAFHVVHNSLAVATGRLAALDEGPASDLLIDPASGLYRWPLTLIGVALGLWLVLRLLRLPTGLERRRNGFALLRPAAEQAPTG